MRLDLDVPGASSHRLSLIRDGGQCKALPHITSNSMGGCVSLCHPVRSWSNKAQRGPVIDTHVPSPYTSPLSHIPLLSVRGELIGLLFIIPLIWCFHLIARALHVHWLAGPLSTAAGWWKEPLRASRRVFVLDMVEITEIPVPCSSRCGNRDRTTGGKCACESTCRRYCA